MKDQTSFKRIAAFSAILAAPVGLGSFIFLGMAVDFDLDALASFMNVITLGAAAAGPLHLAWVVTDFFGTLLLAPAAFYLWTWAQAPQPQPGYAELFFRIRLISYSRDRAVLHRGGCAAVNERI